MYLLFFWKRKRHANESMSYLKEKKKERGKRGTEGGLGVGVGHKDI